jgi:hypothetical protein
MANQIQDSASGDRRGDSDKTMSIALGVVGFDHEMDGLPLSTDHVTRIQLPERLSPAVLSRMRTDFELLAAALRDYPAEMTNLLEAHFRKDVASSRKIAETIGLSEQSFKEQGRGYHLGPRRRSRHMRRARRLPDPLGGRAL